MGVNWTTASRTHRTVTAFEQYVSGRRGAVAGAVFFLETADHLDPVLRIARRADIIISPSTVVAGSGAADPTGATVIGYVGSWREPGDEMTLDGDHAFELQDYLAAPFISIVGLTVVRQGSTAGVGAFLRDADRARHSGVFVDQLLSNAVLLDSRASFVRADPAGDSLVRLHVTSGGEYREGADGLLLGKVGDTRGDIEAVAAMGAGRGRAFARIVDRRVLEADLDDRPWLERYVAALDLLRQWDGALTRRAVSGFGGHLVTALDESDAIPAVVSPDAPFLVTAEGAEFILVDRRSRLRFRLGIDAARVAECLMATGNECAAAALLGAELGRSAGSIAGVVRDVHDRFLDAGIDLAAYGRNSASRGAVATVEDGVRGVAVVPGSGAMPPPVCRERRRGKET